MNERERKDIFEMMGESIEPATKTVGAGASEVAKATGGTLSTIVLWETSRMIRKFRNKGISRRMR